MTKLTLGTAQITKGRLKNGTVFIVNWMNVGSFLSNEARAFLSEKEAREWCAERGLRVVA